MKIGITGGPQTGKTTLFRLLTGMAGLRARPGHSSMGVMEIPDERLSALSELFKPPKTVFARMELVDIQTSKGQGFLNAVRNLDALVVVMGAFMGETGVLDSIDFLDNMEAEFYIADLASVESRLERLKANKAKPVNQMEIPFLEKYQQALDDQIPIKNVILSPHEKDLASGFDFYGKKPVILAVNVSEEHLVSLVSNGYPGSSEINRLSQVKGRETLVFSGVVEEEIESLGKDSRQAFLKEYGLTVPGTARIARAAYASLGLISFFTIGSDEVKAWTLRKGSTVKEAAGKIHSDMERGFIRAEVVSFDDFWRMGSTKACKEKGLLGLQGKEYIVQDGDILDIRFNV